MAVTCIFLRLTGYEKGNVILLLLFWTLLLLLWMCREYMERRKYFKKTAEILEKMDHRDSLLLQSTGHISLILFHCLLQFQVLL